MGKGKQYRMVNMLRMGDVQGEELGERGRD